jgi:hypothetical protein
MLLPIFGFPHKNEKNTKKKKLEREKDVGMLKKGQNWLRRFKNTKG